MFKSGVKTSEFWVMLITAFITAFGRAIELPEPVVAWLCSLALAYLASRTILKSKTQKGTDLKGIIPPLLLLSLGVTIFASGCGFIKSFTSLSALDRSIVTADRLSVWYADLYSKVSCLYVKSSPEKKAWFEEKINPNMNTLKTYILVYVDAVSLWRSTGDAPSSLADVLKKIDILSRDILVSLKE